MDADADGRAALFPLAVIVVDLEPALEFIGHLYPAEAPFLARMQPVLFELRIERRETPAAVIRVRSTDRLPAGDGLAELGQVDDRVDKRLVLAGAFSDPTAKTASCSSAAVRRSCGSNA